MKLKAGDKVKIVLGKDKGREGEIEKVFPKAGRVLVPGVNIYKKHVKGSAVAGSNAKGGIYEIPRPLAIAKVMLICPNCKKPTRVGYRFVDNKKIRICKKCKRDIDIKKSKK